MDPHACATRSAAPTSDAAPQAERRALSGGYRPRDPESTALHKAVREHLETFLEQMRARTANGLPRYAERELDKYLRCGVLAHGFARVRCSDCGHELLVGFSCKARGVCPSCTTRRAHDVAAHLVERVLPRVPYRQWVLTFPRRLRLVLTRRPALVGVALSVFLHALFAQQRRAGRARGVRGHAGAVTFVQHFSSALRLNVHLHVLVPDGVFDDDGSFCHLPAPTDDDVARLLERTAVRLLRRLSRELDDDDAFDADDALLALQNASLTPQQVSMFAAPPPAKKLCKVLEGFSLHAATRVHAQDRRGLERLCHYGARGALANCRLNELPDGRFAYEMKRALPNGRTHLVMTGVELLAKLTPLIPPPWTNLTRYHGVFASGSKLRPLVVPRPPEEAASKEPGSAKASPPKETGTFLDVLPRRPRARSTTKSRYRIEWSRLLERVFGTDVLACACGGRRKLIALIEEGRVARAILRQLGLPDAPLPRARSRGPPEESFAW